MSKIITSILLTLATIASAFAMYTPAINVSAALNDPLRCSFPGRYIDGTKADKPCDSCPVDFYCPTQVRNGSQFSPEKPGKNGSTNSEVIPCPSGTTTKGFTYHPYKLSLLTKDEDGFKVGTLATDISMCKAPNFTCPANTPRLVNFDGKVSCYASCPGNQVEVIKDGVRSCIIECRNDTTTVNGKCFEACASGQELVITNGITNCNDKCADSVIRGQIVSPKGNCECPSGTRIVLDTYSYNAGTCEKIEAPKPVASSSSASSVASSSAQSSNNGGGFNWLGWLGVAAAGYLVYDGLSCGGLFNFGSCGSSAPAETTEYSPCTSSFEGCGGTYTYDTQDTYGPIYQPYTPSVFSCNQGDAVNEGIATNGFDITSECAPLNTWEPNWNQVYNPKPNVAADCNYNCGTDSNGNQCEIGNYGCEDKSPLSLTNNYDNSYDPFSTLSSGYSVNNGYNNTYSWETTSDSSNLWSSVYGYDL
jgi:hypothetical protein